MLDTPPRGIEQGKQEVSLVPRAGTSEISAVDKGRSAHEGGVYSPAMTYCVAMTSGP